MGSGTVPLLPFILSHYTMNPQIGSTMSGRKRKLGEDDDQEILPSKRAKVVKTVTLEYVQPANFDGN
jgi:hypothetical protein